MKEQTQLNAYSREVYRRFTKRFPSLDLTATVEEPFVTAEGAILIKFNSRRNPFEYPVFLVTENNEITVGVDAFHEHFDWDGKLDEEKVDRAFQVIEDIMTDRLLSYMWKNGDTIVKGNLAHPEF